MEGLLVYGDNHFIVDGPAPDAATARALVRQWSFISIGPIQEIPGWRIRTRAFREELAWAMVVGSPTPHSPAVTQLLAELAARGISIGHADPV